MQVSRVFANVDAKAVTVSTLADLAKLATNSHYSLSTFSKNHRNASNFVQTEAIGLDFDEGLTLAEAKELFAEFRHLILPTKSHQKEKNGVTCDRFRVILFLSSPITDAETYGATWEYLRSQFPACDPACKDPSRQFYRSTGVASMRDDGALVSPVKPQPKPKLTVAPSVLATPNDRGELSKRTLKFLLEGAGPGKRHGELFFAARDFHEQGYTQDECVERIRKMIKDTGNWGTDDVNENDRKTIADAFNKEARYEPRIERKSFEFKPVGDLMKGSTELNWLVEGLLTVGGLSIVAGPPKSGKSTIVRQLAVAVSRGSSFLDRKTQAGPVLYLALEEQAEMLNADFRKLGANPADPIFVHVGGALGNDTIHDLNDAVAQVQPALVVIDTFALFANVRSLDNYGEINPILARIRKIARDNQTHVLLIHHSRKSGHGAGSILGSQAIHGAVDNAISFNQQDDTRFISTSQRGGRPIVNVEAVFDPKTNTYKLGSTYAPKDEF